MAERRIIRTDAEAAADRNRARASLQLAGPSRVPPRLPEAGVDGRRRVVIESVAPEIDGGRFPAKRVAGEEVIVEADVFADGHDELAAVVRWRPEGSRAWNEATMEPLGNDRWRGRFTVPDLGRYRYTVLGWVDRFATWRRDVRKKLEAGQDVSVDLLAGADLVRQTAERAKGSDRRLLRTFAATLREGSDPAVVGALLGRARTKARKAAEAAALDDDLAEAMSRWPDRRRATSYGRELSVVVNRERARFSTWYELFARSTGSRGKPGTLATAAERLAYVAEMGFDVVYLPPIHPIGRTHRKGPNNDPKSKPSDPGSPWAIGSEDGGHTAIAPELGTFDDFAAFVEAARDLGMEVALDIAFQCSPDHPWVREHPDWFRHRLDGSIQYAENPPKKYEDIHPLDFECEDWRSLWAALRDVFAFWMDRGIRMFRVDNPHTKSLAFWGWVLDDLTRERPDLIFLSEAFTRPRLMNRLAKLGFTQSYTYFAWRHTKHELTEYFDRDLREVREFFRPNLWPNTPDILTEQLQTGGRAAFMSRLILAATLGASYGIYGPAFELQEHLPLASGKEEYRGSEKYAIRRWDLENPDSLAGLIGRVNRIRRDHPALQQDRTLRFHGISNDQMICYSKADPATGDSILVVVNVDPRHTQSGWTQLYLDDIGADREEPFTVHDLFTDTRYRWQGSSNFVELAPKLPAHIFAVAGRARDERDYENFA